MSQTKGVFIGRCDAGKIETIIKDRLYAHEYLRAKKSKTYEAFLKMERATYAAGALEKRIKELIDRECLI